MRNGPTAVQPSTTHSLHKRKNPLKVLSGELVLNFQKAKGARSIAIAQVGGDVVQLIKNTADRRSRLAARMRISGSASRTAPTASSAPSRVAT